MRKLFAGILIGLALAVAGWWFFSEGGTRDPVAGVQDAVEVHGRKAADAVSETVEQGVDELKSGLDAAGNKISQEAGDATILASIKAKFIREPTLDGLDLNVDVDAGQVTLRGAVASAAARSRAIQLARETAGVKGVRSELVVKPPASP